MKMYQLINRIAGMLVPQGLGLADGRTDRSRNIQTPVKIPLPSSLRNAFIALMAVGFACSASAQTNIGWNFTDTNATYDTGTPANFTVGNMSIANSHGTVATPISTTSASSGYAGSTGTGNIGNAVNIGALNTGTSAYYTVTFTPSAGYSLQITKFDFGTRSTSTGPQAYALYSSVDNYVTAIFTGTIANNSAWSLKTNPSFTLNGTAGNPVTLRLYTYGGAGSPSSRTINNRLDDITITVAANSVVTPTITGVATAAAFTTTYGTASTAQSFSVSGANLTANLVATAPGGFEVSPDGTTYGSTATFTQSDGSASGSLRIRLAATAAVSGIYNSQNIVLSSAGATSVNIVTAASGNSVATKGLTLTGLTGSNKTYDGATTASFTGTPAYSGMENGESFTVTGTPTASFGTPDAGTGKTVTVTGYTAPSGNYSLTQPLLTADINQKALTITANDVTKTYGSTLTGGAGSLAFTSSGLVNSETIGSVTIAYGTGAASGDAEGDYAGQVTPSAATGGSFNAANYGISYISGAIHVTTSPTIALSGTLTTVDTIYGTASPTPTSFSVTGTALTGDLTVSAPAGFEVSSGGGYSASLNLTQSSGTVSPTTINVRLAATTAFGSYSGNVTVSGGGATPQTITTAASAVEKKALTISGLTGNNKPYDGNTTASFSGTPAYAGLSNGESFTVTGTATASFATKAAGTDKTITVTGYDAPSGNYSVTQPALTGDIGQLALTVSGASVTPKPYDGTNTATITGASLVGVISPDGVTASGGGTFADVNAATDIAVTAALTLDGTDAGNYTLTQPSGLTGNITQASQSITFAPLPSKTTSDADFALTATASSNLALTYMSGDSSVATVSGSTVHIVGAGTTTITASQAGDGNHTAATPVSQPLTVTLGSVRTIIMSEDFANLTAGGNTANTGEGAPSGTEITSNLTPNFPTSYKTYSAGGAVKLGTSSLAGSMTSNALDLSVNGGSFKIDFDVKGWTTVESNVTVTVGSLPPQTVTYAALLSSPFETHTLNFTGGQANSTIKFETTNKRAFIDNVVVYYEGSLVTYQVSYDGNTHTGGTAPTDSTAYPAGASVTVLGAGTLTKTGNAFVGWNTAADGSGVARGASSTFAINANTTLFAQWSDQPTNPTVAAAPLSANQGAAVTLTATVIPGVNPASTGLAVTGDLTAIGGSASQAFTAGANNTFTYDTTIPASQAYGTFALPLTVTDAQARTGTTTLTLTVSSGVASNITVFHVNDVHSRLQPHDYDVPGINDVPVFQQVGGAAWMAGKLLALKQAKPNSLVLDAGDISEGGPLGDLGGNRGLIDVYKKIDERLKSLGGRGFDALVVGNHDVRFPEMLTNMKNSGLPFISMNLIDLTTNTSYLPEHKIVDLDGVRVGILGYTTDTSAYLGPDTVNQVRVDKCTWDGGSGVISIKQKVAALRAAPNNCDVVVLLAHIGHSRIFSGEDQLIKDNDPAVPPPQLAITGHWHSMTDTVWQPAIVNHKTTLAEASSYMQHIGEVNLSPTGGYLGSAKHLVDNATITPDAAVETVVNNLITEFNASSPPYQLEQVIGYSATDLRLNKNKWWTHNEFPWSGDNAAGAWISDSMQWWVDSQPGYKCDLALQSGGGVRRDNAAGPITYREIYETYPWRDDNMILMEVKGQEIWNFIQNDFCGTSISKGWKVYANDGLIWKIEKDGVPIDPAGTYSVAISSYMYDHANDKVGGAWSDTTPTTVTAGSTPYSIRQTVIDYTARFTQANPMVVPGGRYVLDTTMAGRFEAVVTMVDDVEDQPYFECVFVRLLRATPDTVARRGGYASADLVNADGSINPQHQFAESMLYRSYLGFENGLLKPGDKLLVAVEGGFHAGNPQLVEQEGIIADGIEFNRIGTDTAAAQPAYKPDIAAFWDEHHENHFVKFQGEKVSTNRIKDRRGFEIAIHQAGAYNLATLPGNVGDQLELTGVQTYRYSERRFRLTSATVVHPVGSVDYLPISAMSAISPAVQTGPTITLSATASDATEQTFSKLLATDDTNTQSGNKDATGNLYQSSESSRMYFQSAAIAASSFGNERMLTQFDLSALPAAATIASAKLRLYSFQQSATETIAADVHAMSDSWDETTATWNNTALLSGAKLGSTLLYPANDQWYEWDVTSTVTTENAGDKIVSFMVKPAVEDSATKQAYTFDTKAYQSGGMGPFLEVEYSGVTTGGGTVTQVAFWYRHSTDKRNWGAWTLAGTDVGSAPWQLGFNYPSGYGHYEFFSVATDNTGNVEPAPFAGGAPSNPADLATTSVHYLSPMQDWRQTHFGTTAGDGEAGDLQDPDHDGVPNVVEYGLHRNPKAHDASSPLLFAKDAGTISITYFRDKAALAEMTFQLEHSDTLADGSWSTSEVQETVAVDGEVQEIHATVPRGSGGNRFVRLRVTHQ